MTDLEATIDEKIQTHEEQKMKTYKVIKRTSFLERKVEKGNLTFFSIILGPQFISFNFNH